MWQTHRWLRFLVVGTANTAFSYGLYAGFLALGLHFTVANLMSLIISIAVSFRTQGTLVFGNAEARRWWRFVLVWAAIYGVNIALVGVMVDAGLSAYLAGFVALGPVVVLSYLLQRTFVFQRDAEPAGITPFPSVVPSGWAHPAGADSQHARTE